MQGLFDLGTYRLMSLEEPLKFREQFPDYVLPSRWVDRWKGTDAGGLLAKSPMVILGFKDPHILELERSAPTPTNEAFTATMQFLASTGADAISSDIKNAFGQSMRTNRQTKVSARLPPNFEALGFKVDPSQLLMAETEVYGFISGPSWLRQSLVAQFEEMGYRRNAYDNAS